MVENTTRHFICADYNRFFKFMKKVLLVSYIEKKTGFEPSQFGSYIQLVSAETTKSLSWPNENYPGEISFLY